MEEDKFRHRRAGHTEANLDGFVIGGSLDPEMLKKGQEEFDAILREHKDTGYVSEIETDGFVFRVTNLPPFTKHVKNMNDIEAEEDANKRDKGLTIIGEITELQHISNAINFRLQELMEEKTKINESKSVQNIREATATKQASFLEADQHKFACINTKLLFSLSKQGRAVLAYIIDKGNVDETKCLLPKLDILNYAAQNSDSGLTTTAINRGIRDLVDNEVIIQDEFMDELFHINQKLCQLK